MQKCSNREALVSLLSLRPKLLLLNKIRVGAVSYLNTKPLLHGIKQHEVFKNIDLVEEYPARIAQLLIADEIDIGLIPVAAIPKLPEWHLVTDFCIGCNGAVASVCIFSSVPLAAVTHVYLDYQSRTSVQLAILLLREYWKKKVIFIDARSEDFRKDITGTAAGVVIGDRALEQRLISPYIYDLGEAWKAHTGLPFVFAAWVANKALPHGFLKKLNAANALGLAQLSTVIAQNPYADYDLTAYYTKCISYRLTNSKRKGLNLFLSKLATQQEL